MCLVEFGPEERRQAVTPVHAARRRRSEKREECQSSWLSDETMNLAPVGAGEGHRSKQSELNHEPSSRWRG